MNAVLILSFNHPEITKRCVTSVLSLFQGQIFLVHNGSKAKNVDDLKREFPTLIHLEFEDNRGFSGGANRGLKAVFKAGAQQCLFLSNDAVLTSLDFPEASLNYGLLSPTVFLRETGRVNSIGGEINLWKGELRHLTEKFVTPQKLYVPGSAFFIHRKAYETLQGFDENLGSYWEDVDLSLRAQAQGVTIGHHPATKVKHGVAKTTGGDPLYTVYYYHRNRRLVTWRHGNFLTRVTFSFVYTAATLRKLFKYLRHGDGKRFKLCLKATFEQIAP